MGKGRFEASVSLDREILEVLSVEGENSLAHTNQRCSESRWTSAAFGVLSVMASSLMISTDEEDCDSMGSWGSKDGFFKILAVITAGVIFFIASDLFRAPIPQAATLTQSWAHQHAPSQNSPETMSQSTGLECAWWLWGPENALCGLAM